MRRLYGVSAMPHIAYTVYFDKESQEVLLRFLAITSSTLMLASSQASPVQPSPLLQTPSSTSAHTAAASHDTVTLFSMPTHDPTAATDTLSTPLLVPIAQSGIGTL
jgi:hypothetical protein